MADTILTSELEIKMFLDKLPEMVQDDLIARKNTRTAVYMDNRTYRISVGAYLSALESANLINTYERFRLLNWLLT